jgi:hypothetical protein
MAKHSSVTLIVAQALINPYHESDAKLWDVAICHDAPFDAPHFPCNFIIPHTKGTLSILIPHGMHLEFKMLWYYDTKTESVFRADGQRSKVWLVYL